ncbi:hypothetical protein COCSADRAFT_180854 [Bipolaris sorokiniana ND90Pr]|uniref:LCCL domain-containing protein n=1 Tax=Cochliobolus sativus (strain ND90Pr / ATCC 201652) TaxID=665912 RepID=M2SRC8_COCSN|nr:uncharacterized protein COCSADRAFT_180854 [Bipolaris sorokiniana ND90Pr]EMD64845.1 hypothetical protein COCSADRAFT_180854 [Bipolaris sorokiniana ND90Pr]
MRKPLQKEDAEAQLDDEANDDRDHAVDGDEEAHLLREEMEFEDIVPPASKKLRTRRRRFLDFWRGPQPPRIQSIDPYFPWIQNGPVEWLESQGLNRPISLVAVLLPWLLIFIWFLTAQLPLQDGDANNVISLGCVDTLWERKNECGIDGIDCRPFSNHSFAFQCPAKCREVQLLNPHTVGPVQVNYRPLVVGTGLYRGDSFLCAAAIHAGIVDNHRGGGGRVKLMGGHDNFSGTKHHGIESIPFDSYFPLSFSVVFDDGFQVPADPRSALLPITILSTVVLAIFSSSPKIFFPIFTLIFAHVSFVSDPPPALHLNTTVLPDHISMFAKRLLPAIFVMVVMYSTTIKRTLAGLSAHIEKAVFWLGGFWIGALSNYTFDWIPISRLTAHDLEQQPGAKLALAIIVLVLAVIVVGQAYCFWLEGRLIHYLGLYSLFILAIIVCLMIPGVNLRIHHYILALLLLPGTSLQTRPSLFFQGLLLGLFVNGIARWDFDSVLQTSAALRADAKFESVVPQIMEPLIEVENDALFVTFNFTTHPPDVDGMSVLVNDVERARAFYDNEGDGLWDIFEWKRDVDSGLNEYFQWAYIRDGYTLDYSKPVVNATAALAALDSRQNKNCPAQPTCPRWNGCVSTATNGGVFKLTCTTDFNGPVIGIAQAKIFVDCADACARHTYCTAFNMKDNFCYFLGKDVGTPRISTENVNAGTQAKPATELEPAPGSSVCETKINCPHDDYCCFKTNGQSYISRCNYDFNGGDIAIGQTKSLSECANLCSLLKGCVAATWVAGTWDGGMCYLKNDQYKVVYNSNVDSVYLER